jgi:hypothetical protein
MSKQNSSTSRKGQNARLIVVLVFFGIVAITAALAVKFARGKQGRNEGSGVRGQESAGKNPSTNSHSIASKATNAELPTIEISQAVMVTVELDFGPKVPSIAEALQQVERRYEPADGVGRTFAVLDAYGEPTPDKKKLHMSMHVSSEKPGVGELVFRRTGEVLWKSKIVMGKHTEVPPLSKRNLLILVDNGMGKTFTIDGSNNPASVLDANVKEVGVPLRNFWPDQTEREFTYIYSSCGCPVKAMVRRAGDRTIRAKELPVIFPDDPAVLGVINALMGWP